MYMVDYLKIFEKCRDEKCGDVFTKKELNNAKNKYIKSAKKCKNSSVVNQVKCSFKNLEGSDYQKLLRKRVKCAKTKCKKEHKQFRNDFSKKLKKRKMGINAKKQQIKSKRKNKKN